MWLSNACNKIFNGERISNMLINCIPNISALNSKHFFLRRYIMLLRLFWQINVTVWILVLIDCVFIFMIFLFLFFIRFWVNENNLTLLSFPKVATTTQMLIAFLFLVETSTSCRFSYVLNMSKWAVLRAKLLLKDRCSRITWSCLRVRSPSWGTHITPSTFTNSCHRLLLCFFSLL